MCLPTPGVWTIGMQAFHAFIINNEGIQVRLPFRPYQVVDMYVLQAVLARSREGSSRPVAIGLVPEDPDTTNRCRSWGHRATSKIVFSRCGISSGRMRSRDWYQGGRHGLLNLLVLLLSSFTTSGNSDGCNRRAHIRLRHCLRESCLRSGIIGWFVHGHG